MTQHKELLLPLQNNINGAVGIDAAINITYEYIDNSIKIHTVSIPAPENSVAANYITALLELIDKDILDGLVVTYINQQMQTSEIIH